MNFEWSHFLELARRLATENDEASQRSAISRAYYAAFHEAKRYIKGTKPHVPFPRDGRAHETAWQTLKDGIREERGLGVRLERLKKQRTTADYDNAPGQLRLPHDAKRAVEEAESLINVLRSLEGRS